jgi:hypothetical protein
LSNTIEICLWIKLIAKVVIYVTKQLDIMKRNTTERFNLGLFIVEGKGKKIRIINLINNNSIDVMSRGELHRK